MQDSAEASILASALESCLAPTLPKADYSLVKQLVLQAFPGGAGAHKVRYAADTCLMTVNRLKPQRASIALDITGHGQTIWPGPEQKRVCTLALLPSVSFMPAINNRMRTHQGGHVVVDYRLETHRQEGRQGQHTLMLESVS